MQKVIEIVNGVARHPLYRLREPVNLTLLQGENIAIVGPNGGGKSMLVDMMTGAHPLLSYVPSAGGGNADGRVGVFYDFSPSKARMVSDNVKLMTFRDSYGTGDASYYYQQRWNQHDIGEAPLVGELLDEAFATAERALSSDRSLTDADRAAIMADRRMLRQRLTTMFGLDALEDKPVILLSSGELRKFQLTKVLLTNPRVLIIDNPFVGLDAGARRQLHDLLRTLTSVSQLQVVLVVSKGDDIPDFITHVVPVADMCVHGKLTAAEWHHGQQPRPEHVLTKEKADAILRLPEGSHPAASETVVDFRHVTIRYGERVILDDLSFTVREGEHWALSGRNGSGKSTLLSIVCADNPQAYANDIVLFGRERGTGESIWDIKRHIGYVSPEMHRAYLKNLPAVDIVASGLSDSIGLYVKPRPAQFPVCEFWMDMFGVLRHRDTPFLQLSSGEQRLVLLARAFVKDPSLLILDEPLHGLDPGNRRLVLDIVETFCRRPHKTLIMVTHYMEDLPSIIDHQKTLPLPLPAREGSRYSDWLGNYSPPYREGQGGGSSLFRT